MTDLRKAAEMALEALIGASIHDPEAVQEEIEALRQALSQPEWVGLTDDEIESELTKEFAQWWSRHVSVCKAIEAKLKEKNT